MSTYDDIAEGIDSCICCLEENNFSEGTLSNLQNQICSVASIVKTLNDYVKSIDDRVSILEEVS